MRRSAVPIHCVFLLILSFSTGSASPASVGSASPLCQRITSLIEQKGLNSMRWGVCFADAEDGRMLYQYDAEELFIPASNRKLFVSALALSELGPDYQFKTPLLFNASHEPGQADYRGDLIVRGVGDPTFLNPRFHRGSPTNTLRAWADLLTERGIRVVHGDIVMDGSGFESRHEVADGWIDRYETAQYAPRTTGICYQGNCVAIATRPAREVGAPAVVTIHPDNASVRVDNETKTGRSGSADTIRIERLEDGPDHFVVRGNIALNAKQQAQRVPVERPALIAGDLFRSILEDKGIRVAGTVRDDRAGSVTVRTGLVEAAAYQSPPLRDLLKVINKDSDNHCAEQLFQAVAFAKNGNTSYRGAKNYEERFLAKVGILPNEANFEDGSGLSRMNLVSPRAVVRLLCHMAGSPLRSEFIDSLSVAGRDGTLAGRMGRKALGRVFAKTGALSIASCLSGYVETDSGELIAFSILVNQTNGRTGDACYIQDKICNWLLSATF